MNNHYKLSKIQNKYIRTKDKIIDRINRENEIKKKLIVATSLGVVVLVGLGIGMTVNSVKESNMKYEAPKHDFNANRIEQFADIPSEHSLIDFENYDSVSLNNFCDNVGSLYFEDDVTSYRTKYEEMVNAKAEKWGIDPNLAMAILTQESRSGKTTNLMQIGFKVWQGESFKVYDFDNQKYVDILLTNDPVLYNSDKYLTINETDLQNPSTNISIGCAMLQYSMKRMNYDIPAGIQCYNYGARSMDEKVFPETFNNTYLDKEAILADQNNFSFMNYTYAYDKGDNNYFYNVSRFLNPYESCITIKEVTESETYRDHVFRYEQLKREYKEYQEKLNETVL